MHLVSLMRRTLKIDNRKRKRCNWLTEKDSRENVRSRKLKDSLSRPLRRRKLLSKPHS